MSAIIMNGTKVAADIREVVARDAASFADEFGRRPGLATVLVGDDPASHTYIRMKREACEKCGIRSFHETLDGGITQAELMGVIQRFAEDDRVDGILVQFPLPPHLSEEQVIHAVPPAKDVDGFHPFNMGEIAAGKPVLATCTPQGVVTLLDAYEIPIAGQHAVVIGRSIVVGRPVAFMLLARDATVTITHLLTKDLASHVRQADIVVSATGVAGLITAEMVKPGATVIDVGTIQTSEGLVGDVQFDEVSRVAGHVSPVPGGIGPMTIATLLENTVKAAKNRKSA